MAMKRAVAPNRPREMYAPYTPAAFTGALEQPWRVVLANPSDLDARSVLADALLEAGDPRGEYLQLSLLTQPTAAQLERRDELFGRLSPEWRRPLLSKAFWIGGFENGLPEQARAGLQSPEGLDWLHERAPIRELAVSDAQADPRWVEWLPHHPIVKHLRELSTGAEQHPDVERLIATGAFASLETLHITAPFTVSLAKTIATHAPALRALSIDNVGVELEPAALRALAGPGLRKLRLQLVHVSEASMKALDGFTGLEHLELSSSTTDLEGARALPARLRVFMLSATRPTVESLSAFLQRADRLEDLALDDVGLPSAAVGAVLSGRTSLKSLSLNSNTLGDEGIAALSKLAFPALEELSLSQVRLSPAGFATLSTAEWPLERADFGLDALDEAGATSLASGSLCRRLRELELLMTSVGSKGARALSSAPWLAGLESLSLFSNRIGNTGLRALLEHMPNAHNLFLGRENPFKEEGLLVATRGFLPKLRHLRVDEVKAKTIEAFVESGHADGLHTFGFGNSELTEAAARALVTLPRVHTGGAPWSRIEPSALELLEARWPNFGT